MSAGSADSGSSKISSTLGDVEHIHFLSDNIGSLFMEQNYSDITLVVENQRFPVHKVILAARSDYFRALLFGGLRESCDSSREIELKATPARGFASLLKYIYTGRLCLSELREEPLLEVLGLANQYGFMELQTSISDYLKSVLNTQNACYIFDTAHMYTLRTLCDTCCSYIDRHAADILESSGFLQLSPTALQELTLRDSFCAPEIDIFKAIQRWSERYNDLCSTADPPTSPSLPSTPSGLAVGGDRSSPDRGSSPGGGDRVIRGVSQSIIDAVMGTVRFPLISLNDLLSTVRDSSLVSSDAILDAIKMKNESRDMELNYRGFLTPEENVATLRHGAQVIRGEMKASLLDGDSSTYDLDRGFTRHPIDDNNGQGVAIKLGMPCIVNTIRMLLWDRDMRSYSYYIEGSLDDQDWVRLVDHSRYLCRSWQYLRFAPRVIRYIRIVGTHNTVNRVFHVVSLECFYSLKEVELDNGLIVASDNVATIDKSAWVIEGVSRSRNALINGVLKDYDWDSGYTCHQLGSGAIVIQLGQPYVISSMRLLLWDCDGRCYSYYIEVSNDLHQWGRVADKTEEACRSWQIVTFNPRPVTFVKIVGTHNTANEVFHCVHFECPADPLALAEYEHSHLTPTTPNNNNGPVQSLPTDVGRGHVGGEMGEDWQHRSAQPHHMRLQGLGGGMRDDGIVDHGDGYGIGFLGGGGAGGPIM